MRQDAFEGLPWASVLADFDAITSAAYSVGVFTTWTGDTVARLWVKTRLFDGAPQEVTLAHLGATPAAHPTALATADALQRLNPFGVAGPWSERLAHFKPDQHPGPLEQIQSEYMVPRAQAATALARLRAIGHHIDPLLYVTEIRTMAGDALCSVPPTGVTRLQFHFTWKREPRAVHVLSAEIENMLLPLGARPHWGKLIHAPAKRLAPLYPCMGAFWGRVRSYDPSRKLP